MYWLLLLLTSVSIVFEAHSATIIWDIHGTLLRRNNITFARTIGLGRLVRYTFSGGSKADIQKTLMDILDLGGPQQNADPLRDDHGRPMSLLMSKWQLGEISSADAQKWALELLNTAAQKFNFTPRKKDLMYHVILATFDSELLAQSLVPEKKAIKLLKKLVKKGHIMTISSNMDAETFKHLRESKKVREVLKYFPDTHYFVSSINKCAKPQPVFFSHMYDTLGCNFEDCIFIDDQEENVEAARRQGMTAFLWSPQNASKITRELEKMGIL